MLQVSRAALIAAMLTVSAAPTIGLMPAMSQEEIAAPFTFTISVPTVLAVGSSMGESDIKDVFSSNFLEHADELAGLDATSITLPEVSFEITVREGDTPVTSKLVYRDVVLANVKDGLAETFTIGSSENLSAEGKTTYGASVQRNVDIRRTFEFLGIVTGADAGMKAISTSAEAGGSVYTSPFFNCTVGDSKTGGIEARPARVSFATLLEAFAAFGTMREEPPPEAVSNFIRYVADLLTGFRGGATSVGAIDCNVPASPASPTAATIKLSGITTGDFEPGIYPTVTINGLAVDAGADGKGSLAEFVLKPTDLNPAVKAIASEVGTLSEEWFNDNWRRLIPSFGGFAFSGVDLDVPNPDKPGERITARIASFDLSLDDYLNGIPTRISTSAKGIEVPLPEDTTDPQVMTLLAAGLSGINFGFDVAAAWDKQAKTIHVDKIGLAGVDLASMSVSATVGNATEQLFDVDEDVAMAASLGVTVKDLTINVTDDGLGAIVWPIAAAEQGESDIEAYRTKMAGFAEGLALQVLGSTDAARALGVALGDFVTGRKGELTIVIRSKDPAGIALPLFMAAQNDPSVLTGQVDVTATAN